MSDYKNLIGRILEEWKRKNDFILNHSQEELDKQYVWLLNQVKPSSYSNPVSMVMTGNLDEGLIHTYPSDKVIPYLKKYFNIIDGQIRSEIGLNGEERIIIFVPTIKDNLTVIEQVMDRLGWFCSDKNGFRTVSPDWKIMQFEKKFQDDYNDEIRKNNTKLYHIAPTYYKNKIMKIGFVPKSTNADFRYPERVYFIYGKHDAVDFLNFIDMLNIGDKAVKSGGKYTVFELDMTKIPKRVKFYYDGNFDYGVFTTDAIPPSTIVWSGDVELE